MAELSADRNTPMRTGELISFKVKARVRIYAGAIVVAEGGYAAPGKRADSGIVYLGRAEERVNTVKVGASDGDKSVLVRRGLAFKWANAAGGDAITQADAGKTPYIFDDQTVTDVATGATAMTGLKILAVEDDGVWVG